MAIQALNDDIFLLIIERLAQSAPECLPRFRLVSKRIQRLAVPFIYQTTTLTPRKTARFSYYSPAYKRKVAVDVLRYARHIVIDRKLELSTTVRFFESMENLQSLMWSFWPFDLKFTKEENEAAKQERQTVLQTVGRIWPEAAIHLVDVTSDCLNRADLNHSRLTTIDLHTDFEIQGTSEPTLSFQDLLINHPHLTTLRLDTDGQDVDPDAFMGLGAESFAPLEKLVLKSSYFEHDFLDWRLDLWNWSKLRHLELLGNLPTFDPTTVLPTECLDRLQTLVVEGVPLDKNEQIARCERLCDLVIQRPSFTKLGLTYSDIPTFLPALEAVGSSLRVLRIWNFPDTGLESLAEACSKVVEMTISGYDSKKGPLFFAAFPKLLHLTLRTKLHAHANDDNPKTDLLSPRRGARELFYEESQSVMKDWITKLVGRKQGARFEKIVVYSMAYFVNGKGNQNRCGTYDGPEATVLLKEHMWPRMSPQVWNCDRKPNESEGHTEVSIWGGSTKEEHW